TQAFDVGVALPGLIGALVDGRDVLRRDILELVRVLWHLTDDLLHFAFTFGKARGDLLKLGGVLLGVARLRRRRGDLGLGRRRAGERQRGYGKGEQQCAVVHRAPGLPRVGRGGTLLSIYADVECASRGMALAADIAAWNSCPAPATLLPV